MKNLAGFSDSLASVIDNPAKCQACGATTRVAHGLCVGCHLRTGLDDMGEASSAVFESVLAEDDVPDRQWRLGNYEILEEIGRGGMGVIYRARQRHSRRIVALKRVLSYHADSHETLVRFRREAEAAASLDHPNILPIYEVGESEDGLPFFSMKYATGGSLRDAAPLLTKQPRECVRLLAKVARATEYAHTQGILHRDLKPGNILLDSRGEPLVCDFGLAKWLDADSDLTRSLTTFGTPGYIAPEQAHGASADLTPAADVYSLGAILFDLLAGRPPFLGAHALSVIRHAAENPAPKLRSLAHSLDRDLETICARCLEREPRMRYGSAGDLANDLESYLEGRSIKARPIAIPARIWRWSRRNPILGSAAAACLLLSAAVTWLWVKQVVTVHEISAPEKSITVLPFENVGQDEKNIVFTEEIQNDISNQLTNIAEVRVIAGSSVQQYKAGAPRRNLREMARTLGVRHVVEGSVRRADGQVEVSAHLIDTQTNNQVWAEEYRRSLPQSLAIPTEVARIIADRLHARISPAEEALMAEQVTTSSKAASLERKGTALCDAFTAGDQERRNLLQAERILNEATLLDPESGAGLRDLVFLEFKLWRSESTVKGATLRRRTLSKQALDKLVRYDPNMPDTHRALKDYYYYFLRDYDNAVRELTLFLGTLENTPGGLLNAAFMERRGGLWEVCVAHFDAAERLAPDDKPIAREKARMLAMQRRYAQAEEIVKRALVIPSEEDPGFYRQLGECRLDQGDASGALKFFAQLPKVGPNKELESFDRITTAICLRDYNSAFQLVESAPSDLVDSTVIMDPTPGLRLWFRAQIARAQHGSEMAKTVFAAAREDAGLRWGDSDAIAAQLSLLACLDAGAGRKEEAIREARKAVEMWPIARDALDGPYLAANLALVYAWTGERDLAIEQLEALAKIPCGPSYGDLKLHPKWDDLRGDPRFEKMVASLAPKL